MNEKNSQDQVKLNTEVSALHEHESGAWQIEWPRAPLHYHTYGLLTPYFKGLQRGVLMGTQCVDAKCPISKGQGELWIPPRADCPDCHSRMEWVELKNPVKGEIYAYTLVEKGGTGLEIECPYFQIDVLLEGVCTIPKGYLLDKNVKIAIGDKVQAGFETARPTNTCLDLHWTLA
ncbi:hypothetical protein OAO01_09230 [Oligoflexia bacterium]|nr:hypothetical protein [Oligoflexia bacterium]